MSLTYIIVFVFLFGKPVSMRSTNRSINITVFAPKIPNWRLFSMDKIKSSVRIAQDTVQMKLLRHHELNISFVNNSNTSDTDALVAAIRAMDRGTLAFIGPTYDYSVLHIAQYAPKWNVPVISPGGFYHVLSDIKTLVRIHASFNSLSTFVRESYPSRGRR